MSSRFKAAHIKVLQGFLAELTWELDEVMCTEHTLLRATMMWGLAHVIAIWDRADDWLNTEERAQVAIGTEAPN